MEFLILLLFSTALAAPATETLLNKVIEKDSRTEKLRKHRFVAECKNSSENSKTLCFALYDVALSFDSQKLDFTTSDIVIEQERFCAALGEALPDSPSNNDSIAAFKSSARWFKDALKKDDKSEFCKKSCFYFDQQAYEDKVSAACQFLLNQFTFLKNQSAQNVEPISKDDESKTVVPASGSAEFTSKAKEVAKSDDVKIAPAAAKVSLPAPAVSQPSKNLTAPKSVEVPEKAMPTTNQVVSSNDSAANTDSQASKQQQASILDESVPLDPSKPVKSVTPAPIKSVPEQPVVESIDAPVTPELAKGEPSPKTVEEIPLEDTNNGENQEIFDENAPDGDPAEKEAEKPAEPNPNYDDDSADDYAENLDGMVKNNPNAPVNPNNQLPVNKLPQEPELVVEDVPQKKVEYVNFEEDPDSNFFTYLCALMFLCVLLYILHQNRHKLLALCLEGRRGRRGRERSRGGSKAAYSKLDCNLEEAIMSKKSLSGKSMDIIY